MPGKRRLQSAAMLSLAPTGAAAGDRDRRLGRAPSTAADAWLLGSITLIAAVLRFATLTTQSYWFDEAQAVHEMQSSFTTMLHLWSANEPNPPLYFVIAWPWARVFGTGEAGLRSLSAVLGVITVVLVYLCGRELISRRAGQVAALLAAVNPFLIGYSQQAREYALLGALTAASLLFFARAWRTRGRSDLAWWAVFSALALTSAYFAGFIVGAEALALVVRTRSRAAAVGCGLLAIVEASLVPHLLEHANHPGQWISTGAGTLRDRATQVPVTFALNTMFRGPAVSHSLLGGAIAVVVVLGLLLVGATDRQLRAASLMTGLLAVVLLVPLLLAIAGRDYYIARALIGGWIPLAVILGAACAAPRARVAGAVAAVVLVAGFLYGDAVVQYGSSNYRNAPWRAVAAALGPARGTRAIVAYDAQFATAPLALYLPGVAWTGGAQDPQPGDAPVTVNEIDIVGSPYQTVSSVPGAQLVSRRVIDGYLVVRYGLAHPMTLPQQQFGTVAETLLQGSSGPGSTLIQTSSA